MFSSTIDSLRETTLCFNYLIGDSTIKVLRRAFPDEKPFAICLLSISKQNFVMSINQHLARKYPGESWTIERGDKDNPHRKAYFLDVTFHNEPNFTYTYYINSGSEIKQSGISCPDGKFPKDGKHTEWYQDKPE